MSNPGGRAGAASVAAPSINTPGNPSAGADISFAIGTSPRLFVAMTATLVTSATATNRFPSLVITDSAGHILVEVASPNAQAASVTQSWCWMQGGPVISASPTLLPGPFGLVVPAAGLVKTVTAGIQVGDQWSLTVITLGG